MNPQPLLPLHSNETSREASARQRAMALYHAEPAAEDGLFTAVSKWLTRHPRVIAKLGMLSAVFLAIQHMASHSANEPAVHAALSNNYNGGAAFRHILGVSPGERAARERRWDAAAAEWTRLCTSINPKGSKRVTVTITHPDKGPEFLSGSMVPFKDSAEELQECAFRSDTGDINLTLSSTHLLRLLLSRNLSLKYEIWHDFCSKGGEKGYRCEFAVNTPQASTPQRHHGGDTRTSTSAAATQHFIYLCITVLFCLFAT